MGDKTILESTTEYIAETGEAVSNYISETAEAVGDYLGATSKEEGHKAERKVNTEEAKKDNASITDRISAAGNAVVDGAKEVKEGGEKKVEEEKAENAKDKILGN